MKDSIINDIIGWDTIVWGQSIKFFDQNVEFKKVKNALELGSGNYGGYSLYFASKNIDTICSNPYSDFKNAKEVHSKYSFSKKIKYEKMHMNDKVSKISIVGAGMVATPGITYKMFRSLADENINILAISTSEIKISVIIDESHTIDAIKKLHKTFNLD